MRFNRKAKKNMMLGPKNYVVVKNGNRKYLFSKDFLLNMSKNQNFKFWKIVSFSQGIYHEFDADSGKTPTNPTWAKNHWKTTRFNAIVKFPNFLISSARKLHYFTRGLGQQVTRSSLWRCRASAGNHRWAWDAVLTVVLSCLGDIRQRIDTA